MNKSPHLPRELLHELIRAAERDQDFKLNIEDFDFLTKAIESFISLAVQKFIAGGKEHFDDGGDFVSNVCHEKEIANEAIDLWMYIQGLQAKRK